MGLDSYLSVKFIVVIGVDKYNIPASRIQL